MLLFSSKQHIAPINRSFCEALRSTYCYIASWNTYCVIGSELLQKWYFSRHSVLKSLISKQFLWNRVHILLLLLKNMSHISLENWVETKSLISYTRKCLGVQMLTTAWDWHWGGDETLNWVLVLLCSLAVPCQNCYL